MTKLRLASISLLLLLFAIASVGSASAQADNKSAKKVDEFGDIQISDLKARLDNYAVRMQQEPNTRGFIIVYRTRRDLPGLSHALAVQTRDYLLENRAVTKDRLVTVDGGVAMCLTQELWIVPPGSAPKPRDDVRSGYFYYPDQAWKFYEYGFLPPELSRRFGVTPTEHSDLEYLEAFATELRKKRSFIACIMVYAQFNPAPGLVDYAGNYEPVRDVRLDPPGVAGRRLALERQRLIRGYGIPPSRIRTIDGGYRKRRCVELWIVPSGEPLPVATPNSYPKKRN